MTTTRKPADIASDLLTNPDGITVPGVVGQPVPTNGYVVGVRGFVVGRDDFTEESIVNRVERFVTETLPEVAFHAARFYGAWQDWGLVYIDMVEIVSDRSVALELAADRGEVAIFDLDNNTEIFL